MYLTQWLHRSLQQTPEAPMTIFRERRRTVAESADRIARLAAALRKLGVQSGDRVAILGLNSDRYHEYLLAVAWAGGVVNPVNTRWSAAEIAFSLEDSETGVLLVDSAFVDAVPAMRSHGCELRTVIFAGEGDCPADMFDYESLIAENEPVADECRGGNDPFGIFYTGGTTGQPKGVMLSHQNVMTCALGILASGSFITERGCVLISAPMFHLAAVGTWMAASAAGSTLVIEPMFTTNGVAQAISRHQVTDIFLVPTMIQMLLDDEDSAGLDMTSLRRVAYGASPISESLLDRIGNAFPRAGLAQGYGMTELGPTVTYLAPGDHTDPVLRRSAGRAMPHAEVRVVDAEDNELPRGQVGEIVVRGDSVMLGYWNRPVETSEALRGGWMHTGDMGRMDERGYLYIIDRIKDMIITGGENVYSAEVENALASHPAVATTAVIGVPSVRWGESVHAVVVLHPEFEGTEALCDELRAHCRAHIAGYKVPRSVDFVDALPLSAAGKILKRELREQYWGSEGNRII